VNKPLNDWSALQERLGVRFRDPGLLRRALTHRSYLNEHPECGWGDNERLELLGDAVGDLIATEYLYQRFADQPEGQLTHLRAELVRSDTLARFALEVGLGAWLLLGKGEERAGGRSRTSTLGDTFEAVLGAMYLDRGLTVTQGFFLPFLRVHLESSVDTALARDAKTRLQEWAQSTVQETPTYATVGESGPDHAKEFTVEVRLLGQSWGRGTGVSKQAAEQAAAQAALDAMALESNRADT